MLETAIEEKRKREDLKAKRDLLFERYLKHPMDTRLAIEIKNIDDQIADLSPSMTLSCPSGSEVKSHFQNVSFGILRV